jgi:uncharacterized membrane protein YccC
MSRSRRAKEAIKTGLAMAIVYWIAMRWGWMNPYWAAFSVAFVSLPTQGQSLNKGVQRLAGTLVGCVMGLFILGLFPQERWSFVAVTSLYCGLVTYLMTGRKLNYVWFCAGFVCVLVTLSGQSSENVFRHAVARTGETAMGIVVWTLISVFLWPQTNAGTLKKISSALAQTQADLFRSLRDRMLGTGDEGQVRTLMKKQVSQLGQLGAALDAAGAESYEVHEVRRLWLRIESLAGEFMAATARWAESLAEVQHIDVVQVMPGVHEYFAELDRRFEQIKVMFGGTPPQHTPTTIDLAVSKVGLKPLSHFDRAAIAVTRTGLLRIEAVTRSLFDGVHDLKGFGTAATGPTGQAPRHRSRRIGLPVLDPDRLRASVMVMAAIWTGFLVWVYFDPPGHASLMLLPTIFAFVVAQHPWMKLTPVMRAFAVALPIGVLVYVFIMPRLSSYVELGPLIFTFSFVSCYFFPGLGRTAGLVALITMVPIQNQQSYSFAALANSYIYVMIGISLAMAVSYITFTHRPEKAFLHLLGRFFRSSEFAVSRLAAERRGTANMVERWRRDYHRQQLRTLPHKLAAWGGAIDHGQFPANSREQVESLVTQLQALAYRLRELVEAGEAPQADLLVRELLDDVRAWRRVLQEGFRDAAEAPEIGPEGFLRERVATRLASLEKRTCEAMDQAGEGELTSENYESFYGLLGGYRGVSEAALSYVGVAGKVNWDQWRESRF